MQQGDPIEERYKEWTERGPASDQLTYCINSYREAALSKDTKFDHIDIADKQKVFCTSNYATFHFNLRLFLLLCN